MPSPSLFLHAHPGLGSWTMLCALAVLVGLVARRRVDGRLVGAGALGALTVMALAPPRGGPVRGLARTCDLGAEHLLWPWDWVRQDPRLGAVAVMLLAGLAVSRRPGWVAAAATTPVLLEAVQYAVPSLARACSVPDVLHLWIALAVGVAAGSAGRLTRRWVEGPALRVAVTVAVVALVGTTVAGWTLRSEAVVDPQARVPLLGEPLPEPPWSRSGPAGRAVVDMAFPGAGTPYAEMARTALGDVRRATDRLAEDGGLPPAGPTGSWDYFWPRDGAFMAVALARTGDQERAAQLLSRVSDLYLDPLLGFDARYLLSGERVSHDPRGAQGDGCGWVLWAVHEAAATGALPAEVDDLRDRCTDQLLRASGGGSHLPAPGQDYWEQTTYEHLLGVSAPVVAGLRFAAADYRAAGDGERAGRVQAAAVDLRTEVARHFGPGYLRAGTHGGLDAATAMLMPPFDPEPLPGAREAWLAYQRDAARPAGGLAPGSGWKEDGISWTPEVALVAYTAAAAGEDQIAHQWLTWLDEHRAPWGSLPEKVDFQGRPGGPAPLGWTAALVVLTLDELGA